MSRALRCHGWIFFALGWSLLAVCASADTVFAVLLRQPYLQLVTPTSVTLVWRTDLSSPNDSRVQYGTGALNQTATGAAVIPASNANAKDHFVTVNALAPGTKYFYNVGTTSGGVEGGGTAEHYFVTAPNVGSTAPFTVWALGDSGAGNSNQQAVRNSMLTATSANPPSLILHLGDIAYESGTDSEFTNKHFNIYQNILRHTPLWPSFGNHEGVSSNATLGTGPYFEAHVLPTAGQAGGEPSGTGAYYSFDYGNAHFIVLDSQDNAVMQSTAMLDWLQADLANTTQDWVIAYWHHPPYSKGTHNSDSASDSDGRMVYMRETVVPILEAGGVDLVLTGHSHSYERSYFINGAYNYPNFVTPDFATLWQNGDILDERDGDPAGDGAYLKDPVGNHGAVYVVAGHGGKSVGGTGGHPVMRFTDVTHFGSLLLDIDGSVLTLRNLLSNGSTADVFSIDKSSNAGPADRVVIRQPGADFPTGGSTTLEVMVQDAAGNRVSTDSTTQITFDPTLSGTISGVVTGTGDSSYGVAGGPETVTVMAGIARITLNDNFAETFQVAITNDANLDNPPDDSITVTGQTLTTIALEAEAGSVTAPMAIQSNDPQASGGQYVEVPNGTGNSLNDGTAGGPGQVSFAINIPQAGTYTLWARILAPNTSDDSFYVTGNGSLLLEWNTPRNSAWQWREVLDVPLSVGTFNLAFRHREDGTKLDRIVLTNDPNFVPAGNQVAITQPGADFAAGGNTNLGVTVQTAGGSTVTTDNATQITFDPTLNGTVQALVTGNLISPTTLPAATGAPVTVRVASGVAAVTLANAVAETFEVAVTNNAGFANPANDSITVTGAPATQVAITQPGADFTLGGTTNLAVAVQTEFNNTVTTDNTTQITFDPTLSGTVTAVVTGTLISPATLPAAPGTAVVVRVTNGVAAVTLTDNVVETFQVAITNNAGLIIPTNDSIMVTAGTGPNISNLNPTSGPVGTSVVITGTNFGASQGTSTVRFNGIAGTPTNWSAISITVPVPAGAATGNVVVTVNGTASNGVAFTVTAPAPNITNLNPTSGPVGTSVVITGTNFGASQGTSTVSFNGIAGTPTNWSAISITVPVPVGAATGNVVVTVNGTGSNGVAFTVTGGGPTTIVLEAESGSVTAPMVIQSNDSQAFGGQYVEVPNGTGNSTNDGTAGGPGQVSFAINIPQAGTYILWARVLAADSNNDSFYVTGNGSLLLEWDVPDNSAWRWRQVLNVALSTGTFNLAFRHREDGTKLDRIVLTNDPNFVPSDSSPSITNLNPTSGPVGTSVVITGTNFGASQGTSTVSFNGIAGTPTNWSATSITVPVPVGAATGNVVVTVNGTASNGVAFTVTGAGPNITNLNPTSGPVGTSVVITGTNFGASQGTSTVSFNGVAGTPTNWSAISITVPVPVGAATGNVVVTVNGTASNGVSFTVTGAGPNISNLNPTSGPVGTSVVITGTNFGASQGTSTVSFNGIAGTPTNWSAISITVPVPVGAATGNVVVTVNGTASNGVSFTVTGAGPNISNLNPTSGPVGTSVVITGTNFGASQGTSTVSFNGIAGTPTNWSAISITVPVPVGAATGNVVVTVNGTASNGVAFTVTGAGPNISNLNPTSGPVGTSVVITGTNFGASQGTSTVSFNGIAGTPTNWSAISITVPVPVGAATGNVVVTVNGTGSNGVAFTVTGGGPTTIVLEAESGSVTAPMVIQSNDSQAFGGQYVEVPNGTGNSTNDGTAGGPGQVSFAINIPQAGTYILWARVLAADSNNDSFYVTGNGSLLLEWDVPDNSAWRWRQVLNVALSTGTFNLAFRHREDGTKLDRIVLTNDPNFVPSDSSPSITNLNPTSGPVGTSVVITGTNFGASQGTSTVTFNGTAGTPTNWSATSITVPVPVGATTGNVVVTVNATPSNGVSFTVTVAPNITNLNPTSGPVGTSVVITGTNFGASQGTSTVSFNGIAGTPTNWSAISITVPVPVGAATGNVVVTVNGTASNGVSFTVTGAGPNISNLNPTSGPVGTSVVITGTNFGASQGTSTVSFNGIAGTPTNWSAISITVPVPVGAATGNVVVTVNGTASNGVSFTVTGAGPTTIILEAETGTLTAPMVIQSNNPQASGGQYVEVPNGTGNSTNDGTAGGPGQVSFAINIPQAGTYTLWARILAVNSSDDSFYVTGNGSLLLEWNTSSNPNWRWREVLDVALSAGTFNLAFRHREDGTKLDRIVLTNDPTFVPSD